MENGVFDKYEKVKIDDGEYALVGIEDPGKFALGVKIGEKCNAAGFYPTKWLAMDGSAVTGVAEASDYKLYFNPETEAVEMVQS